MIKIIKADGIAEIDYINLLEERTEAVREEAYKVVDRVLKDVKETGDKAVTEYTERFDGIKLSDFAVTEKEKEQAYNAVDNDFLEALKTAKENIWEFHENQKQKTWMMTKDDGILLGQTIRALDTVGIYVPGGTAAYPSSVIMNAVPAKVAGVNNIIMVTPPSKDGSVNPNIIAAAKVAGIDRIYKIGGAQAIGALAYGTESIPKVDKIVGPGNIYVALAKRSVFGNVDIDMIAGPSEILIISDETSNPKFLAADLMSQAEHDILSSSILVTTSMDIAEKVQIQLEKQVENLSRKEIIEKSLKNYGAIIVTDTLEEAVEIANKIAPEHLELMVKDPMSMLSKIKNAGSIFLGDYSPEPLGDYFAGPNHVLPTSGTARFFSPLSVDSFIKKSSFIYYTEASLKKVGDKIIKLADTEGLTAHANSIKVRLE
jgi:histidinol dehydrogenase